MNYYSNKEFPQLFHVLPFERKHMADEALKRIRESDKTFRAGLSRELNNLIPYTETTHRKDLVVGRRYGVFGISPFANAWRAGTLLQNHGDGTFRSDNAWNGYTFDAYPAKGAAEGILVEL